MQTTKSGELLRNHLRSLRCYPWLICYNQIFGNLNRAFEFLRVCNCIKIKLMVILGLKRGFRYLAVTFPLATLCSHRTKRSCTDFSSAINLAVESYRNSTSHNSCSSEEASSLKVVDRSSKDSKITVRHSYPVFVWCFENEGSRAHLMLPGIAIIPFMPHGHPLTPLMCYRSASRSLFCCFFSKNMVSIPPWNMSPYTWRWCAVKA